MSDAEKPISTPWVSRIFHALLIATLLVVIGIRVYGYFASSETEVASAREALRSTDIRSWRATGNKAYSNKQWDTAAAAFEKITQKEPNNLRAWVLLARSLHSAGHHDRAISAYLRVSQFAGRPQQWALCNIAAVYALKNEKRMALDYLQEAVAAGYRQRESDPPISADPDFRSVADDPEFKRLEELTKPVSQRNVYRQFDFAIGQWNLVTEDDRRVGSIEFAAASRGYALLGKCVDNTRSLHTTIVAYYEPERREWKQLWLEQQGTIMEVAGTANDNDEMLLEGDLLTADGRHETARVIFEEGEGGLVRLTLMKSPDSGNRWDVILDVMMVPRDTKRPGKRTQPRGSAT
jgi:tetratricopeptide (TPR) repeat protein